MKITKFEQSAFVLESDSKQRLALDFGRFTPIERLAELPKIDFLLVSHIHGDHFSPEHISAIKPTKVYLNQECLEAMGEERLDSEIIKVAVGDNLEIGDFKVSFFNVDHGPNVSAPVLENFGFLIEVAPSNSSGQAERIYFAGDMYYESGIDVTELEVDIALIPVGGFYTFGPNEAFEFVKKFKKIGKIISMHYEKTPETCEQFLKLVEGKFSSE